MKDVLKKRNGNVPIDEVSPPQPPRKIADRSNQEITLLVQTQRVREHRCSKRRKVEKQKMRSLFNWAQDTCIYMSSLDRHITNSNQQ